MSKIAEQKALEAYPNKEGTVYHSFFGVLKFDENATERRGYQEGYDQAMKDFLEKADKFFNEELFTRFNGEEYRVASNKLLNLQQFIEYFKNYMQDES